MNNILTNHLHIPSPLHRLSSNLLTEKRIELYIKRDDLIHPDISGNKWRKLKYNIIKALQQNKTTLVSFGGTYSNHLVALASAANLLGIESVGYVRGDKIDESNNTIQYLRSQNMILLPLSRTKFRNLNDPELNRTIYNIYPNAYIIPLGGTNELAIKGIKEMMDEINQHLPAYNYICTPIGSGGTAAGIINNTTSRTLIFNTFKKDFTTTLIAPLIDKTNKNWETINGYHFGKFGSITPELDDFVKGFRKEHGIQLDYIYNGKMMYGLINMINMDKIAKGSIIVAIHTGGIQGNPSTLLPPK